MAQGRRRSRLRLLTLLLMAGAIVGAFAALVAPADTPKRSRPVVLWGFSALAKVLWPDPDVLTHTMVLAGWPRVLGPLGYWGLTATEGAVALLLVAPRTRVRALWLSLALAGLVIAARVAFKDMRDCACFGTLDTPTWLGLATLLCALGLSYWSLRRLYSASRLGTRGAG